MVSSKFSLVFDSSKEQALLNRLPIGVLFQVKVLHYILSVLYYDSLPAEQETHFNNLISNLGHIDLIFFISNAVHVWDCFHFIS